MSTPTFDVELIAKHWSQRTGFFALLIPLLLLEVYCFNAQPIIFAGAAVATAVIVEICWRISRRTPTTRKGKIGFVMSIACDDESEAKKIRADFIYTLRRLLVAGRAGGSFQIIEVPQHRAALIVDSEDALRLRLETNAKFVMYGRVRLRKSEGKPHYFMELDGVVSHGELAPEVKKKFAEEFSELLPRRVMISADDDLFGFQFTSEWAHLVAKYIIGIAAATSGDLNYAMKLELDVMEGLQGAAERIPVISLLKERVPKFIAELNLNSAQVAYLRWFSTKDHKFIKLIGDYVGKVDELKYGSSLLFHFNAIYFLLGRNDVSPVSVAFGFRVRG